MNRLILGAVILMGLVSGLSAGQNNGLYYVDGFYKSTKSIKSNLIQNNTKLNNSCGPTSLLFAFNHYYYKKYNRSSSMFSSLTKSKYFVKKIYSKISTASYNTDTTLGELRGVAKSYLNWKSVARKSSNSSFETNRINLIKTLKVNKLALIVLDGDFVRNPVYDENGFYRHIVIVYAYQSRRDETGEPATSSSNTHNKDRIYYYAPYYGNVGYVTIQEIHEGALAIVNLAYLQIAPK